MLTNSLMWLTIGSFYFRTAFTMNPIKIVAILLIVGGALGLAYGGFSYTKDTTAVKIGTLELSVKEKQTINVPMWAGIAAIVAGGLLLAMGGKNR